MCLMESGPNQPPHEPSLVHPPSFCCCRKARQDPSNSSAVEQIKRAGELKPYRTSTSAWHVDLCHGAKPANPQGRSQNPSVKYNPSVTYVLLVEEKTSTRVVQRQHLPLSSMSEKLSPITRVGQFTILYMLTPLLPYITLPLCQFDSPLTSIGWPSVVSL